MSKVVRMYADSKYHNFKLYEWVDETCGVGSGRSCAAPRVQKGWVKLPIRWTVERTFAWLGRCRRLSKDREKSVLSSESFVKLAMIQLMLHRLRAPMTDAEFRYREAGLIAPYGTDSRARLWPFFGCSRRQARDPCDRRGCTVCRDARCRNFGAHWFVHSSF